jgi:hypothetical protein
MNKMTLPDWDRLLSEKPLTPKIVKKFCSEEGGLLDLTEADLATYPRVLAALHIISGSYEDWKAKQTTH